MEYTLYVTAERSVVRESLKGVIWTIFFHRLFGPITPTTNEFLGITYSMADNLPELDTLIDEKVDQLIKLQFDGNSPGIKQGHVIIQFLDKKAGKTKKSGWLFKSENDESLKLWESWIISIDCLPIEERSTETNSESSRSIEHSVDSFEANLHKIIQIVDAHKDHIPPITSLESSPFPYTIDVGKSLPNVNYVTEGGGESWGRYIRNMLD